MEHAVFSLITYIL